jgi:WbqC-like protein
MSIAIMQPYVFPYIGYFQLIYATDVFVFYDDVNFINRGWINRNRILVNGKDQLFTIPCKDASQNKLIKDVELADDPKSMQKLLATIQMAYNKAPYFNDVYPVVENTLTAQNKTFLSFDNPTSPFPSLTYPVKYLQKDASISGLAISSVTNICDYLGLKRVFKISSEEYENRELKKADRLIDICHIEKMAHYINPSGGKEIYTKEYFKLNNIDLGFLVPRPVDYVQFKNAFVPWLSVIDVLMFNSKEDINNKILPAYNLE